MQPKVAVLEQAAVKLQKLSETVFRQKLQTDILNHWALGPSPTLDIFVCKLQCHKLLVALGLAAAILKWYLPSIDIA